MFDTPYELAKAIYLRETTARSFEEDLRGYMANGYVFCTPTSFLMGRPVKMSWPYEYLTDPTFVEEDNPDCWWVGAAAGDIKEFILTHQPFHLKYYGWERRDAGARFYMAQAVWMRLRIHYEAMERYRHPSDKIRRK